MCPGRKPADQLLGILYELHDEPLPTEKVVQVLFQVLLPDSTLCHWRQVSPDCCAHGTKT